MKKRAFSLMMTAAMVMALCVGGCGAFATESGTDEAEADTADEAAEAENEASDEAEDEPEVDEGFFVAGFFSDSATTYYEDADTVSDIVSGIGGMEFAAGAAASEDIADGIQADADLVTAVTYDAEDVDFDTEGEYDIVYRVFISADCLQDYLWADADDSENTDEDTVDIESDYIDICIPAAITITEADEETTDIEAEDIDEEAEDVNEVTVAEVNELTWMYDEVTSIPDVITGIGSIEYETEDSEYAESEEPENEDIDAEEADDVEFDADAEIVDAVLYDTSRVDEEEPDAEDVAYFTYFDREALMAYMDEADIDMADYPGLEDAYTDHIMVYYGPLTELDFADVLDGMIDQYVLQDSENIDYTYGVTYDDTVIKDVTVDASAVDVTMPGTYPVKYTVTYDTGEKSGDVRFNKNVMVVTAERADELVKEGKTVWTDDNKTYGKTDEAAADTTAKGSTEVASNDTKADDTADNAADTGSSSSANTGSVSASSGSNSGSSSNSSSGSSSSGSSGSTGSSSGETQHVHDWVATYHPEQGHYESVLVSEGYYTKRDTGRATYVCNGCGYSTTDGTEITLHTLDEGCGYHSENLYEDVWVEPIYQDKYVVDTPAYTTYVCSGCGATK